MLAIESRGARDVAKRAHETISQIFRYAIAHGIASRNPAADFKPKDILAEAKEENFSCVDVKELPTPLTKMINHDGDAITRLAMRLMAYAFVRTSELIEAERAELELDNARWDTRCIRREPGRVQVGARIADQSPFLEGFRPRLPIFVRERIGNHDPAKRKFGGSSSRLALGELRKRLPYFNKPISLMAACRLAYGDPCRKGLPQGPPSRFGLRSPMIHGRILERWLDVMRTPR